MTLREAIEKAEHELEDYRRRGDNSKLHEILAALDPDSEVGNPNVDSVILASDWRFQALSRGCYE